MDERKEKHVNGNDRRRGQSTTTTTTTTKTQQREIWKNQNSYYFLFAWSFMNRRGLAYTISNVFVTANLSKN